MGRFFLVKLPSLKGFGVWIVKPWGFVLLPVCQWSPGLLHTWNPNDPCFDWKGPCFGGLTFKNRGQLGSRYLIVGISIFTIILPLKSWNTWRIIPVRWHADSPPVGPRFSIFASMFCIPFLCMCRGHFKVHWIIALENRPMKWVCFVQEIKKPFS